MMTGRFFVHHHEVRTAQSVMWVNDMYYVVELDFGRGIITIFNADTGAECNDTKIWHIALMHRTNEFFKREGLA